MDDKGNTTKTCRRCKKRKRVSQFHKDKNRKDGFYPWCISCTRKYTKSKNHFHKRDKEIITRLKRVYGLTLVDYDRMFEEQNGVCILCEQPEYGCRLAVDHNHKTGKVRGLLCKKCNLMLGFVERNPNMINKIKNYLEGSGD